MKSFRNRLRQAVLASLPAVVVGCTNGAHGASSGTSGGTTSSSAGSTSGTSGSTGGLTSQNLCDLCAEEGLTCNSLSTACVSYCTLCMCAPASAAPVGPPTAGLSRSGSAAGGLQGGLSRPQVRRGRRSAPPLEESLASSPPALGEGGCPPLPDGGDAGPSCVICNVEDCTGDGRLPEGLCAAPIASRDAAGAFFARSAHLEAASVVAFERMARELERFGAPGSWSRAPGLRPWKRFGTPP